ncbi:MAG: hypothetical protein R3C18_25730 [Planctomycetaceae bacterium]
MTETDRKRLLQRISVLEFAIERGEADVQENRCNRMNDAVFIAINKRWRDVKRDAFRILGIDESVVATGGQYLGEPNTDRCASVS